LIRRLAKTMMSRLIKIVAVLLVLPVMKLLPSLWASTGDGWRMTVV
jgi:hypothetical protein